MFDVPEIFEVHPIPSDEVSTVPFSPTTTNLHLPNDPPRIQLVSATHRLVKRGKLR
jgi:hypothetical protein